MRVIICDDEKSTCARLEQMLKEISLEKSMELEIDVFFEGTALTRYLEREAAADILFLDIQFPGEGINGVEVGKYIRETLNNPHMFLVYISSREEYAMELFQNQPFDFLVKPVSKERLARVMEKIFAAAGRSRRTFKYKSQGRSCQIRYEDILYFQSEGRKINIVTDSGTESFYGKLSEVEKECPGSMFLRIHKSSLVNMQHTREITYEWMKMGNGDVLDISRANRAAVRRKIMESMTDEIRNGG